MIMFAWSPRIRLIFLFFFLLQIVLRKFFNFMKFKEIVTRIYITITFYVFVRNLRMQKCK